MSWQAALTAFALKKLFKPRLASARDAIAARKVMNATVPRPPRGVHAASGVVGGVPGEWMVANGSRRTGVLLYLHGGGYFACSPQTHRGATAEFATHGLRVFAPDYRLAPEHPFPGGLEDAVSVYRALAEEHGADRIVVAGDSAGGGLTMALLLSLRDQGVALPAAAAVFSPMVDLTCSGESVLRNSERCAMFNSAMFPKAAKFYLGDRDPRTPLASPLYADLHGLPPLLIHVGEDETLLDDSRRLAAKLTAAGVNAKLKVWPTVPHVWQLWPSFIPEGRASIGEASTFFEERLRASQPAEA